MRPNMRNVTKPRSESSKYLESVPRVAHFFATESAVYLPMRAPNNGISGKVRIAIKAEVRSKNAIVTITEIGVSNAETICGRKRPK